MRFLVVLVAAGVVALAGARIADDRACADARAALYAVSVGTAPASRLPGGAARVRARCRDAREQAGMAALLDRAGRRDLGVRLARAAARRDPEAFEPWRVLAGIAAGEEREAAERRARALSPLWPGTGPSRPAPSPRG